MNGEENAAPANLIELINRLAEPAAPPPVPMMPQTAGWAVLGVLALIALALLAVLALRRWRANAYRRAALAALADAGDDPAAIADIVRRTALAAYGRTEVASLYGAAWLAFLDRTGGGDGFTEGPGAVLAVSPYRVDPERVPGLGELAARWVRRHGRHGRSGHLAGGGAS